MQQTTPCAGNRLTDIDEQNIPNIEGYPEDHSTRGVPRAMPIAPARPCSNPTCPGFKPCPIHQPKRDWQAEDKRRGTAHGRGYGWRWQKLRLRVMREEPLCRLCLAHGRTKVTQEVDHIVPKAQGGTDARNNLQGICCDCHKRKTAKEKQRN